MSEKVKQKEVKQNQPQLDASSLAPRPGATHRRKRLGIGEGSGNGKTCGKGQKGQRSRSGFGLPAGFEGGQMPIYRRLPKVGFISRKKTLGVNEFQVVGLDTLAALATEGGAGAELTLEVLRKSGLVRKSSRLKILAGAKEDAKLSVKLNVEAHAFSASAKKAIEQAGGVAKLV